MLGSYLQKLKATGDDGFEGLIRSLLAELSGFEFRLSRAGSQYGRDASARGRQGGSIMFECKRYLAKTDFKERELTAEITQATLDEPMLDLWVLATSRRIPEQLVKLLGELASKSYVDFLPLDCGETDPGPLDNLCAAYQEIVIKALSVELDDAELAQVSLVMEDIASRQNFHMSVDRIRSQLLEPSLGWPAWRESATSSWLMSIANEQDSRARFGQSLALQGPATQLVERKDALAALDMWWQAWTKHKNPFFMLGEEGDGKTWSVATWITKNIQTNLPNFPAVVFIPSSDAKGVGILEDLVLARIKQEYGDHAWEERLRRWRTSKDGPLAIVVLDGLNERQSHDFWRNVIDTGLAGKWKESLAIICTLRTGYWFEFFKELEHLNAARFVIQPYDDRELSEALLSRKLKLVDFPEAIHSLLRKPRYFDLAVKHRRQLTECGDFTLARLIYEDWKDRYNRKNSSLISSKLFNSILKSLGTDFMSGQKEWQPEAVAEKLALSVDKTLAFRELSTGGVLKETGTGWAVEPNCLALGLGMLLCAQLRQTQERGENLTEALASWIEPYFGADLQSQILELAALHSLMTDCSSEVRVELLAAWLGTQNPTTHIEDSVIRRFTAYLPGNTNTYCKLAEKVWSTGNDNPWAQEILLRGFIRWVNTGDEVIRELEPCLKRWLGMVPINGQPAFRQPEKMNETATEAQRQLAIVTKTVTAGAIMALEGYSFQLTDNDGWLRLSRASLAIISSFPDRELFLEHIVTAMIGESIFGDTLNYPEKMDLLRWLLRSSQKNITDRILQLAEPLSKSSTLACQRAAARLFTSIGTEPGWNLWQALNHETLFPTLDWVKKAQESPFESFFAVPQKALEEYPETPAFAYWAFLQHSREMVTSNSFIPKGDLRTLLAPAFDRFTGHCLWSEGSLTPQEHFLDQNEPALARFCSNRLGELIRANFVNISERMTQWTEDPTPLPYFSYAINKYELLLTNAERKDLLFAWHQKRDASLSGDKHWRYAESILFQSLLPLWTGREQLDQFLNRNTEALDLVTFADSFVADAQLVFKEPTTMEHWKRLVVYLICTKQGALTSEQFRRSYTTADGDLCALCLRYLYVCKATPDIDWLITSLNWHWKSSMSFMELEYGAALLLEYASSMPLPDLLSRIPPTRRGMALVCRAASTKEFADYAQWIDTVLCQIFAFELRSDLPALEIDYDDSFPASLPNVSIVHPEESRSIHFVSPETVWGGGNYSELPDFDLDVEEINKRWEARYAQFRQIQKEGASAGNHWIATIFHKDGLKDAIAASPTHLDRWIAHVDVDEDIWRTRLFRARAFYQTLCVVLFESDSLHRNAACIYKLLTSQPEFLSVFARGLKLPQIDLALLSASRSASTEQLWMELLRACQCDKDLLELAILIRTSEHRSDARQWFKEILEKDLQSDVPFLQARAYGLLGFLEENPTASWGIEEIDDDTYWLKEVQKTAQRRYLQEQDARHWFEKFCSEANLDDAWCAFRLFIACVDRRAWLWITEDKVSHDLTLEKLRFFNLNSLAIEKACKKNEEKLEKHFIGCRVDSNLFPWLRFSV